MVLVTECSLQRSQSGCYELPLTAPVLGGETRRVGRAEVSTIVLSVSYSEVGYDEGSLISLCEKR